MKKKNKNNVCDMAVLLLMSDYNFTETTCRRLVRVISTDAFLFTAFAQKQGEKAIGP